MVFNLLELDAALAIVQVCQTLRNRALAHPRFWKRITFNADLERCDGRFGFMCDGCLRSMMQADKGDFLRRKPEPMHDRDRHRVLRQLDALRAFAFRANGQPIHLRFELLTTGGSIDVFAAALDELEAVGATVLSLTMYSRHRISSRYLQESFQLRRLKSITAFSVEFHDAYGIVHRLEEDIELFGGACSLGPHRQLRRF